MTDGSSPWQRPSSPSGTSGPCGPDGRYVVESDLGVGGMGVVHVALDTRLQRRVALKVVSPQLAGSPEFRERFHREASTLARLDSPHVIAIYDHGDQDGRPYLATQLVRGGDLGHLIAARGALPPQLAVAVCAQVADALGDAHAVGVVHRDIKPSNVLVRDPDAARLHVYLCDFGIAVDQTSDRLTTAGAVVGTWAYLAPERTEGGPAGAASDIYALGCLLWVCLTGQTPYSGTDVRVAMAHVNAPVRQLVDVGPSTRGLNQVLARTMAKDPAQRYGSAAEVREALASLASLPAVVERIEPVPLPGASALLEPTVAPARSSAPPPGPPPPTTRSGRGGLGRRGVLALVGAAVLVAVVGVVAVLTTQGGAGGPDDDPTSAATTATAPTPTAGTAGTATTAPGDGLDPSVGGDVDGDGRGDVVATLLDGASGEPRRFLYRSDRGRFVPVETSAGALDYPSYGDLDGDDGDDVDEAVVPLVEDGALRLRSSLTVLDDTTYPEVTVEQDIGYADLLIGDGDGDNDLVVWGQSAPEAVTVWVLAGDGDAAFSDPVEWLRLDRSHVYTMGLSLADYDRDGMADLLAVLPTGEVTFEGATTSYAGPRGTRLYVSGDDRFTPVGSLNPDDAVELNGILRPADYTGDGTVVVALPDPDSTGISFYEVDADGALQERSELHIDVRPSRTPGGPRFVASDVDDDGDDDVVLTRKQTERTYQPVQVAISRGQFFDPPEDWADAPPQCKDTLCFFNLAPTS